MSEEAKPFDPQDLSDVVLPMPPTWSDSEDEEDAATPAVVVSQEDLRKEYEESLRKMQEATHHTHSDRKIHESKEYDALLAGILTGSAIRKDGHILRKAVGEVRDHFIEEYVKKGVPVMLSGIPEEDEWPALSKWESAEAFLKHYGNVPFKVTEFASDHGIGKALAVRLPMFMYEEYTRSNTADFPFYSFEADFEGQRYSLLGDYKVHALFKDDLYDTLPETRVYFPRYRYMIIGGDRTGTNLHIDPAFTGAWNTLLCGKKLWVLFPPGNDPEYKDQIGATMFEYKKVPPAYWWLDVYGRIKGNKAEEEELGMIECVQNEGDTIFVPGGWWHVVINIGFTVAITQNLLFPAQLPEVWPQMKAENPSVALQFAKHLLRERPHVCEGIPDMKAASESTVVFE